MDDTETKSPKIVSMISLPFGDLLPESERIKKAAYARGKDLGYVATGFAPHPQEAMSPNDEHIAYVFMNESGRMDVKPGEDGIIATSALAGCTGIAGFARRKDGSIATFISHYDTMVQYSKLTGKDSPANKDMRAFRHRAKDEELDCDRYYVIAYEEGEHNNPDYGQRKGDFKDWSYIDQLNVTSDQLGENSKIIFLPYNAWDGSHSLASGKSEGVEGIFWDGRKIDIDEVLRAKSVDGLSVDSSE
jgi:hypothetical protein